MQRVNLIHRARGVQSRRARPAGMSKRVISILVGLSLALVGLVFVGATPAYADSCYTWNRTLAEGSTGSDVRQLQIRMSGYPGYGAVLALDGAYGLSTKNAVIRFQRAYGLTANGIASTQVYSKVYALQDADCTPVNFSYAELNDCNSDWSGGAVSPATAKANALVTMWKLQAMRHELGDESIRVTSGFRSYACNNAVGGSSQSRHLYGDSADLGSGPHSLCTLAKQARWRGFRGILGPGYPGHSDHTHLDYRDSRFWSASDCGI